MMITGITVRSVLCANIFLVRPNDYKRRSRATINELQASQPRHDQRIAHVLILF
jgi:hypothetical protein